MSWGKSFFLHLALLGLSLVQFHRSLPNTNGSHILFVRLEDRHSSLQMKAAGKKQNVRDWTQTSPKVQEDASALKETEANQVGQSRADSRLAVGATEGKNRYLAELREWIESRKEYPEVARRLGQTGRVTIAFRVKKDGAISHVQIKSACPFQRLNEAAVALMNELQRFRPFPPEIQVAELEIEQPILYELSH